jgi:hypothetical protein
LDGKFETHNVDIEKWQKGLDGKYDSLLLETKKLNPTSEEYKAEFEQYKVETKNNINTYKQENEDRQKSVKSEYDKSLAVQEAADVESRAKDVAKQQADFETFKSETQQKMDTQLNTYKTENLQWKESVNLDYTKLLTSNNTAWKRTVVPKYNGLLEGAKTDTTIKIAAVKQDIQADFGIYKTNTKDELDKKFEQHKKDNEEWQNTMTGKYEATVTSEQRKANQTDLDEVKNKLANLTSKDFSERNTEINVILKELTSLSELSYEDTGNRLLTILKKQNDDIKNIQDKATSVDNERTKTDGEFVTQKEELHEIWQQLNSLDNIIPQNADGMKTDIKDTLLTVLRKFRDDIKKLQGTPDELEKKTQDINDIRKVLESLNELSDQDTDVTNAMDTNFVETNMSTNGLLTVLRNQRQDIQRLQEQMKQYINKRGLEQNNNGYEQDKKLKSQILSSNMISQECDTFHNTLSEFVSQVLSKLGLKASGPHTCNPTFLGPIMLSTYMSISEITCLSQPEVFVTELLQHRFAQKFSLGMIVASTEKKRLDDVRHIFADRCFGGKAVQMLASTDDDKVLKSVVPSLKKLWVSVEPKICLRQFGSCAKLIESFLMDLVL